MAGRARAGPVVSPAGGAAPWSLPLVRHLSARLTPWLLRTPLTPNQITLAAIAASLTGALLFADGGRGLGVAGALLVVAGYVLDNCDGEVARARGLTSRLGALLDSFGDWLVHAALFVALGLGASARTGNPFWLWCGWVAAAGTTINSALAMWREARAPEPATAPGDAAARPGAGAGSGEWLLFAFRELSRADFCFLLLALALLDVTRLLLPAAALGAQVYWLTGFLERARGYHV